jgi:hypothetical protein
MYNLHSYNDPEGIMNKKQVKGIMKFVDSKQATIIIVAIAVSLLSAAMLPWQYNTAANAQKQNTSSANS